LPYQPIFAIGDLVKYNGVVWRIGSFFEKDGKKWCELNLETFYMPKIKEAAEVALVTCECRDGKNITSTIQGGYISYLTCAPLEKIEPFYPDHSPEEHEHLRKYVQEKLQASGVIDEYNANPVNSDSIAAYIVADAWRQYDRKYYADMGIEHAIKYPPAAINHNRFSLRAFIKDKEP